MRKDNTNESIQLPPSYQDNWSTGEDLLKYAETLEPVRLLFGDFIHEESLVHFPSERGTGKTFLALQLAMAISNCWESFLGEPITSWGNVIFVNAEMGMRRIAERWRDLSACPPQPITSIHHVRFLTTKQNYEGFKDDLIKNIEQDKTKLVIIDNWTMAFQHVDPDRKETSKLMRDLLMIKDRYKFALVIVDHTRKGIKTLASDSDLQSGSGAKSDLSDQDFLLRKTKEPNIRILKRIKSRNAPEQIGAKLIKLNPDTLWFELEDNQVNESDWLGAESLVNETEETKLLVAKQLKADGKTIEQIAEVVNIPKSTLHRKLQKTI